MTSALPDASMRESLEAAARELAQIAALGRKLQDRLGPILKRAGDAAFEAQTLDDLVQHAQGLEVFLAALGGDCAEDWRVSCGRAASGLGLAAQRRRLAAPADDHPFPPPLSVEHGEMELF